jgi:hypothetical protein
MIMPKKNGTETGRAEEDQREEWSVVEGTRNISSSIALIAVLTRKGKPQGAIAVAEDRDKGQNRHPEHTFDADCEAEDDTQRDRDQRLGEQHHQRCTGRGLA